MRFTSFSLTTKLNLLLAVAAGVALLVSGVAFVANDIRMLRAAKVKHLLSLADTLAASSADALANRNDEFVHGLMGALESQESVHFGGLYDAQGRVVSAFHRAGRKPAVPAPGDRGYEFAPDGNLHVYSHVAKNGERLGAVRLHAGLDDLRQEVIHYVRIVALIATASLSSSVVLSSRLQRLVSQPILDLAAAAQRISSSRDYSWRVRKQSDDELGKLYDEFNGMLAKVEESERDLHNAHSQLESRVAERTAELSQANLKLSEEIAERERAEQELAALHSQLVHAAHRAGMAEIATDVLHNVGNVLNSVNVSCALASERLRSASVPEVQRLADLLDAQRERLAEFVQTDRGRQVPEFLKLLAQRLIVERDLILAELANLTKNVDHIKTIVSMQQSYAGVSCVVEEVSLADLLDEAVRINGPWLESYSVEVVRQYAPLPPTLAQKQKLLQVLVNLVQNARDALVEGGRPDRRLILRIAQVDDETARLEVIDNGVGIAPENLNRIFGHGFTTKHHGHGFGLHSCANALREMGGRLGVHSDGVGCGAAFTLEVPLRAAEVAV